MTKGGDEVAGEEPAVMTAGRGPLRQPSVNRLPVMVWVTGDGGGGRFFNAAWQEATGRPVDDLLADGWFDVVHADDRSALVAAHRVCNADGVAYEMDCRLRGAAGAWFWVRARGLPDSEGGCTAVAVDISDWRRLEEEHNDLLTRSHADNARLASLQGLTASLAKLTIPAEVAQVVLGEGVAELGATSASLCLLDGDGVTMRVAASVGYPEAVTDQWGDFPLAAPTPAGDAVRAGAGVYVSTLSELHIRYPIFTGSAIVGDQALAVLPLSTASAGPLGAMVFGFAHPREFPQAERELLDALAAQAAIALARTRSRAELEAAREQLVFLADASERLAASLDMDQTLATVAALAVPRLADRCAVHLLAKGQLETRRWAPDDLNAEAVALDRHPIEPPDQQGAGAVLRTGQPLFVPAIDAETIAALARSEEHHHAWRQHGIGGAVVVALRARGRLLGALALANRTGHTMDDRDRALVDELAARAAIAIDNAQLYATQVALAHRLQASLLPPTLPVVDGLDLAARYAAAGDGAEVGGDFYDCIRLGPNRILVVVGDVKGKGVDAAVVTGMARHVIRAVATSQPRPADVLAALNDALWRHDIDRIAGVLGGSIESEEPRFCSVLAVSLTRRGRGFHATVASAGHPLPLVRRPDGQVVPVGRPGQLLGIGPTVDVPQVAVTLMPGSLLVCYTDGVSECHRGREFFDEQGIVAVLAGDGLADASAETAAAGIEQAARDFMPGGEIKDDMAILAVRILP